MDILFHKKRGGTEHATRFPPVALGRVMVEVVTSDFPKGHGERVQPAFDLQVRRLSGPHTPHGFRCSTV